MTAAAWAGRARRRLAVLGAVRALAWASAVLLTGLAVSTFVGITWISLVAVIASVATLAALLWSERFVWSIERVALWLEERLPELRYALVTAIDPRYAESVGPRIEPLLRGVDPNPVLRRAARRSVVIPVFALALAAAAFTFIPGRASTHRAGGTTASDLRELPNRLEPLNAKVAPPNYARTAGVEAQELEEPSTIAALAGSTVEIVGPGAPDGITVQLGDSLLTASAAKTRGENWRVAFTLPDSAAALRFEDRQYRRLIVLAPVRDRQPILQLILPARDTTVREPTGSLTLDARLTDDIGVASARFEYIIASGESEGSFTFREGVVGAKKIDKSGVRDTRHGVTIPLRYFDLKGGDQLTVRAVALDNNDWSGPGVGYSEPRTLRVARPGEYDSLAVDPAPPPADSMLMTLRWLIELVQRLENSRDKMPRQMFVDSSRGFGRRAERLRIRVQQLQADHTMGGMFPANPLLTTAYYALWEGEGALKIAEPGESLPHLWDALHALQQYAWAERYYLRGRSPEVLVDLARVRLTGTEKGHAAGRTPRGLADTTRVRLRQRYAEALALLEAAPDSARERLALIQVDALHAEPQLATALGAAIAAIHAGRDPAAALQHARRILEGPAAVADTLPSWSGAW